MGCLQIWETIDFPGLTTNLKLNFRLVGGSLSHRIKMSGNPKANMGAANPILDKIPDKKRGTGIILCLIDKKTYLRENLIALPIEYV